MRTYFAASTAWWRDLLVFVHKKWLCDLSSVNIWSVFHFNLQLPKGNRNWIASVFQHYIHSKSNIFKSDIYFPSVNIIKQYFEKPSIFLEFIQRNSQEMLPSCFSSRTSGKMTLAPTHVWGSMLTMRRSWRLSKFQLSVSTWSFELVSSNKSL